MQAPGARGERRLRAARAALGAESAACARLFPGPPAGDARWLVELVNERVIDPVFGWGYTGRAQAGAAASPAPERTRVTGAGVSGG
ncbi:MULTISPECIES: hypothetical protein [Sorangium]|uniref:Uncharacterized protein n=1 Tax=Sorangium cellulosum TaxID=56 RepID=A0A4P2QHW7_SORCE|nr:MULTISPECIES: hypothetical protein [Sorangium]AUX29151.1 uncharacterized protein SOCE836_012390 [Sorangium cellulosum]WCQ88543.1 hypothetical protein NQZ70_01222 [Sorangium sp. Soce836]